MKVRWTNSVSETTYTGIVLDCDGRAYCFESWPKLAKDLAYDIIHACIVIGDEMTLVYSSDEWIAKGPRIRKYTFMDDE